MKRRVVLVLSALVALTSDACDSAQREWEPFRLRAEALLRAASEPDSARVAELPSGADVATRLAAVNRDEPALLRAAADLHFMAGDRVSRDTVYLTFTFPYGDRIEVMDVGFVRRDSDWRVYYVGYPHRM